jgi:hypothetical protein
MTIERPTFPPVDPTRRRFLVVTGGAAAALAPTVARAASPPASQINPALYTAGDALKGAHGALMEARCAYSQAWAPVIAWEEANPQPADRLALNRWRRKNRELRSGADVDAAWLAQLEAEQDFRDALVSMANIRTANRDELLIKAAFAALYESERTATLQNTAVISFSVACEMVLYSPEYAAAGRGQA